LPELHSHARGPSLKAVEGRQIYPSYEEQARENAFDSPNVQLAWWGFSKTYGKAVFQTGLTFGSPETAKRREKAANVNGIVA